MKMHGEAAAFVPRNPCAIVARRWRGHFKAAKNPAEPQETSNSRGSYRNPRYTAPIHTDSLRAV